MILAEAGVEALLPRVMMIFAGFWTVTLIVLFLAIGVLLRRHDTAAHHHH